MRVSRRPPVWSPTYLVDGQNLLHQSAPLSELLLVAGPAVAARTLANVLEGVTADLHQPTFLFLDYRTAGPMGHAKPVDPSDSPRWLELVVPSKGIPYDMAFRGLVYQRTVDRREALVVVTDDIALRFEARGHTCVVIGVGEYLDRVHRHLARRYADRVQATADPDDLPALIEFLIDVSRKQR